MTGVVCWLIQRRLGAYQDGELGPAARAKTAAHLERCGVCALERAALGRLRARLTGDVPEPPEALWDAFWPQVRARLAAVPEPEPRTRRIWASVTGHPTLSFGSAVAAVALGVVALLAPWTQPTRQPETLQVVVPGVSPSALPKPAPVVVQAVETGDPNSSVMVFTNEEPDVTVVWVFGLERT